MLAVQDVVTRLKELKVNALHIKLRGRGGNLFLIQYRTNFYFQRWGNHQISSDSEVFF